MSISIVGEALIDLIPQANNTLLPLVGGSPFNVARALGRQGTSCTYLSPLSTDHFGDLLYEALENDNVLVHPDNRSAKPSSLAVVSFDADAQPHYSLYREGVADRDYNAEALLNRMPSDTQAIHSGSLALVPDDAPRIRAVLDGAHNRGILISLDINMRPNVVADEADYVDAVNALLPLCDLVKASDEDLKILGLTGRPETLCNELRRRANAALAIVTLGAEGAIACTQSVQLTHASLPVSQFKDTVGAGDCFMAGILSSLNAQGYLNPESLRHIEHPDLVVSMRRAGASASLNIMAEGCQPPNYLQLEQYLRGLDAVQH